MEKLSKAELLKKAKQVFGLYPASKSFHFTSDGQAFTEKSNAVNHGKTLEVKDTVEITKSMAEAGTIEVPNDPAPKAVDPSGAKNEFQKIGAKSEKTVKAGETKTGDDAEMVALLARYEELSEKKAPANIKLETLIGKVQELEAEISKKDVSAAATKAAKEIEAAKENKIEAIKTEQK
jgi:hypothetical protein